MHTDRYVLALAMLDGDRGARQVLADMLEEQGERGLAQWAREGRRDKRRTLEFGVMLLSSRPAIGLAAEIIGKTNDVRLGPGKRMVMAAQHWASRRMEAREAVEACRWSPTDITGYANYGADGRWELLLSALERAAHSEQLTASGDVERGAARDLESRQIVRHIMRATIGLPPPMASAVAMRYQSNVAWQTDQLQQLLKYLVTSAEDLWPR